MTTFSLAAFGGAPAPAAVIDGLASLARLPPPHRDPLWPVVECNLAASVGPGVEGFVRAYCAETGADIEALVPIVRGLRVLFREAALRDVAPATMTQDLNLLSGEEPDVVKLCSGWYERALPLIRTMHVIDGLADFGAVMTDVRLRTTFMPTSQHQPGAGVPVTTLALSYEDAGVAKRLCVQLSPQMVARLKAATAELR